MPNLQRGGGMPQFCLLFYMHFYNPGDPKGGHGTMPPLNTPLETVKTTTILTVRAKLPFKKKYSGRARNKSVGGIKNRGGGMPPAGDAPESDLRT